VAACNITSPTTATALVAIDVTATPGPRAVVVTNPDGQTATFAAGFTVTAAAPPPPPPPPPPPVPAAPTALLTASINTVAVGGSSTLTFATTNATTVTISPIGSFAVANGTVVVSPAVDTLYTLTATGPGGSASSSLTVAVVAAPGGPLFADTFNRSGALGAAWTVATGNFTLDGAGATASVAPRDEAVVAGLSVADAQVKVVFTLAAGGTAGARLRRNAVATSGYAVAASANGSILIQRVSGGVATILKGATTTVAAGQSHALAMKVTGTSPVLIQIDLDSVPLMTFSDTAPARVTAAGAVSIEGSVGSRWDDVQVF
jgi:hypothetical protein